MVCFDFDDLTFSILFLKENQWTTKISKINVMIWPKSSPFKSPVCLQKELNPMRQRTIRQSPASSLKHWIHFWERSKNKRQAFFSPAFLLPLWQPRSPFPGKPFIFDIKPSLSWIVGTGLRVRSRKLFISIRRSQRRSGPEKDYT